MAEHDRYKCQECVHICANAELLEAPNPFCDTHHITGCPNCKAVESMRAACSIDGCTKEGTCGGTHDDGVYRFTCYEHAEWLHRKPTATMPASGGDKEKT